MPRGCRYNWLTMDLDYTHRRLMAAIKGIADGEHVENYVPVGGPEIGKKTGIESALNDAITYLDENFHEDELPEVDRAYKALNLQRASIRKRDVAADLLKRLRSEKAK